MLSINTNLSSIIAQHSMSTATAKLNQAIERMTTGAKINHAKDNAAGYSIATNMTTKMNAYMVAQDNTEMGLDMVTTAEENLSQMGAHAKRLRELAVQARNGTYGKQSLQAMQEEANAITKEIERLYNTAEYNGVKLLNNYEIQPPENLSYLKPKVEYNNFIDNPFEYSELEVENMEKLSSLTDTTLISSGKYSISTEQELIQLAKMVNDGYITGGEFVLAKDIDLCKINDWTPIGTYANPFLGTFNGNGHIIKNLKSTQGGLFGCSGGKIRNVGLLNSKIESNNHSHSAGGILSYAKGGSKIVNTYFEGIISGNAMYTGSIVAYNESGGVEKSYAKASIKGHSHTGGISGYYQSLPLKDCFFEGKIVSSGANIGGIIGGLSGSMQNCYSNASIQGVERVGGVVGLLYANTTREVKNCHAYGSVKANSEKTIGELIGTVSVTSNDTTFGSAIINNCSTLSSQYAYVGVAINHTNSNIYEDYDLSWEKNVSKASLTSKNINLQININSNQSSSLKVNTNLNYGSLDILKDFDLLNDNAIESIDNLLLQFSAKETELGAVSNRLESVLDEIEIQYNNLASSRSTIRDADIAEVSSEYIKMQILQQASSTLLATANQTPSIALQLI